ncbi:FtsX-like permease family protein [Streptomyces cadmiisoli]|uniref:ABC transporter permease n=1 Tax=Streptomyces cadmiisoli TaxID=2184053 RepID=A0A2Z4J454_9ACTN|nr:FtsX-like permease family protein [Streptomyces cadmiisoli]AWW39528.1 ABC transporter permease [Streptomyces cadmiisoli]
MAGVAGFVVLRARAHRLLLTAALLTVLLTTAVLTTLTAYSGAIGDAALRHSLQDTRNAADTALIVKADVPADGRAKADSVVRDGARKVFDGLPVTVRTYLRSGPYALPGALRPEDERSAPDADPDLTYLAALESGQVRITEGRAPRATAGTVEAAVPATVARSLGLAPGDRLTLVDRLGGPDARVVITGVYRPADTGAPYWQLDDLDGRGITEGGFTTYGPLLAAPETLTGGKVSAGQSGWLASADFSAMSTDRTDALREAAAAGSAALRAQPALSGSTATTTQLPAVLDRLDRSLLVSRSTLLIITLQLVLLAGCALLLVARLLSAERAGETRLLRARGASGGRIAGHAALEALLLAAPAVVCAPLLAAPLTRLLAGQGPLARIGLRLEVSAGGRPEVWLVAVAVALGCALAVTAPALSAAESGAARVGGGGGGKGARSAARIAAGSSRSAARSAAERLRLLPGSGSGAGAVRPRAAVPAPLRAGADVGLLVVAAVAYWQLDRHTSGAVSDDRTGTLGIDPLLVAAPALALLAGTVLTLRLLPPVARLAERRAAGGRGLTAALAGWQLSRRPMRGAGPVLLLVLAVALGMLTIGQGASWNRSQDDQADFRAGAPVRVLAAGENGLGLTDRYAAVPDVERAAPAVRTAMPLSGDRTATVLALDTARAADTVLMRPDLTAEPVRPLLTALGPEEATAGTRVPARTARLHLTATLRAGAPGATPDVTLVLEDRYGTSHRIPAGELPADGRRHTLTADLGAPLGPTVLTGLHLNLTQPTGRGQDHRLTLRSLTATAAGAGVTRLPLPTAWRAVAESDIIAGSPADDILPSRPVRASAEPLTFTYRTGYVPGDMPWFASAVTYRLHVVQPAPAKITALATDRFLESAGARPGQRVDVPFDGRTLPVRITGTVRALPTTPDDSDGGALLLDLRSVNRVLQDRYGAGVPPTEWWLGTAPGRAAEVAAALRARPELDPAQVLVRDEIAGELRDDPFGAGPEAAFTAAAAVAAALAAVGFAVSAAGSLRARDAEFAVLRALGAPRRRIARTVAAELAVLVGLALLVGAALGAVLTRAVVPLIVLTSQATRPMPEVLVELPVPRVAVLLTAVALVPLLVTAALALRRTDPARALRETGGE